MFFFFTFHIALPVKTPLMSLRYLIFSLSPDNFLHESPSLELNAHISMRRSKDTRKNTNALTSNAAHKSKAVVAQLQNKINLDSFGEPHQKY